MEKLAAVLSLTTLVGCGAMNPNNKTLIVLQHPQTQQTVQCSSRAGATWNPYAEVESCAQAYEKAGTSEWAGTDTKSGSIGVCLKRTRQ
jgi:hypothetical protein